MVVLGAGGHAKELLDIMLTNNYQSEIAFFDNVTPDNLYPKIFREFHRIKSEEELKTWLAQKNNNFIIGVGEVEPRSKLRNLAKKFNGVECSLTASNAVTSNLEFKIGEGVTIMSYAFLSASVTLGNGVLVNTRANIHHDVSVGEHSEIGPNSVVLGKAKIGEKSFIGAGAVILPKIEVGNNCIIGAGSVVTKNIPDNSIVKGNPAKYFKTNV